MIPTLMKLLLLPKIYGSLWGCELQSLVTKSTPSTTPVVRKKNKKKKKENPSNNK